EVMVKRTYFFFPAEDGIRGFHVTGVQTCALPIFQGAEQGVVHYRGWVVGPGDMLAVVQVVSIKNTGSLRIFIVYGRQRIENVIQIGRASCRERVEREVEHGGGENK